MRVISKDVKPRIKSFLMKNGLWNKGKEKEAPKEEQLRRSERIRSLPNLDYRETHTEKKRVMDMTMYMRFIRPHLQVQVKYRGMTVIEEMVDFSTYMSIEETQKVFTRHSRAPQLQLSTKTVSSSSEAADDRDVCDDGRPGKRSLTPFTSLEFTIRLGPLEPSATPLGISSLSADVEHDDDEDDGDEDDDDHARQRLQDGIRKRLTPLRAPVIAVISTIDAGPQFVLFNFA